MSLETNVVARSLGLVHMSVWWHRANRRYPYTLFALTSTALVSALGFLFHYMYYMPQLQDRARCLAGTLHQSLELAGTIIDADTFARQASAAAQIESKNSATCSGKAYVGAALNMWGTAVVKSAQSVAATRAEIIDDAAARAVVPWRRHLYPLPAEVLVCADGYGGSYSRSGWLWSRYRSVHDIGRMKIFCTGVVSTRRQVGDFIPKLP
jgi:hypothetical protein